MLVECLEGRIEEIFSCNASAGLYVMTKCLVSLWVFHTHGFWSVFMSVSYSHSLDGITELEKSLEQLAKLKCWYYWQFGERSWKKEGIAGKPIFSKLADRKHDWNDLWFIWLLCFLTDAGGEGSGQGERLFSCDSELPDSPRDLKLSPWRSDESLGWRL